MKAHIAQKIDKFFKDYPTRIYRHGHIIIYGGERPGDIFYLMSGQVRQYDITTSGKEIVVNVFKPGAFFPIDWTRGKASSQYFFEASTTVQLKTAPIDEAVRFLKNRDNNDVTFELLKRLSSSIGTAQRRMAHLMGGNSYRRVLFELITECRKLGRKQDNGSIILALHEDELGKRSGLSRETVNREIAKLKEQNLITVTHKELIIQNIQKLRRELGNNL